MVRTYSLERSSKLKLLGYQIQTTPLRDILSQSFVNSKLTISIGKAASPTFLAGCKTGCG